MSSPPDDPILTTKGTVEIEGVIATPMEPFKHFKISFLKTSFRFVEGFACSTGEHSWFVFYTLIVPRKDYPHGEHPILR